MSFEFAPISIIFFLGVVTSSLLTFIVSKRRPAPGATPFAFFNAAAFLWSATCLLEYASVDISQKMFWAKIQSLAIVSSGVFWLVFTLEFTGHHYWRKISRRVILCLIPLITIGIVCTNEWHGWYWSNIYMIDSAIGRTAIWEHGFWFWISASYQYFLVLTGSIFLMGSNPEKSHLKRKQLFALILGAMVPLVFNVLYLFNIEAIKGFDFTPLAIAISSTIYALSIFRYHLLDVKVLARNILVEKIPEGILVLDANDQITDVNPAAEQIAGFKILKDKGKLISQVWPEIKQLKSSVTPSQPKAILYEKNDRKIYLDISVTPFSDKQGKHGGELIVLRDVTDITQTHIALERKLKIEETVARISTRFVGIFDIYKDTTDSLADIGKLCNADRAYLFLINAERNEMNNTHEWCAEGVGPQINNLQNLSCDIFPWWMAKLRRNEILKIPCVKSLPPEAAAEKEILTMQGISSVLVFPVMMKGELAGFVGLDGVNGTIRWDDEGVAILRTGVEIVSNALERYKAEQRIRTLFNEEKEQRQELQKEILSKANFISVLAHELKTPLTPLLSSIELLSDQNERDRQSVETRLIANACAGANTLNTRLDELLELAKLTTGTVRFNFREVLAGDFIDGVASDYRPFLKKRKQQLLIEVATNLPAMKCDPERLGKTIAHLLDNASSACKDGDTIILRTRVVNSEFLIEVEDRGAGITKEEQERLFEPYHRVEQDMHRLSGMGLAMAITNHVIKAHCGWIQIQSEEGKRNIFRIGIPVDRDAVIPMPLAQSSTCD